MKKGFCMIVLITLVLFLCPNANVAHAATYANGERLDWNRKMTEGRSIYYWLAPGNDYTVSIPQAAQNMYRYWNHWTNYVILAGVTPESNAILNEKY